MTQSNSFRLGFPALITALCIARGVVPDSLTFESLSPAINLAFMRKNCWNPDDPPITFPGTRKARARGPLDASAPYSSAYSSSAPPTPASPTPPSTPAPPHEGFHGPGGLARNPAFPLGEGKAPTTQEQQPEVEATPEGTPKVSPAATPLVEIVEDEDGAEDTDYAVDMAVAQSTWDPWPTTTQDTPQPAQDAPSSPYDEPTLVQD
ncbi:predicted GPI-anchored protein 58 [Glycine max]|uniref:predicted GPI-anchored protein 58 n=1 Tax=Glycine max TaxID=3847 RepID=UPI0007193894|nr:predicted GPI-anchored protein 58 [Glycine max]|eukprot:XP_014617149.1 predicted GPI-anchored protein 58 [Glycine max]